MQRKDSRQPTTSVNIPSPMKVQTSTEYHRFCPCEERVKIYDAISFGRPRTHDTKYKGCQFNDDEQKAAGANVQPVMDRTAEATEKNNRDRIESIFKSYDVRGMYPDALNADIAWRIGQATAQFMRSELRGYDRSRPDMST